MPHKSKKDYSRKEKKYCNWFEQDPEIIEELEQILSGNFNFQQGEK